MKNVNTDGFTVVELIIASTVFSVVLLICTFGLIQIGKVYYKGVTISRTQETARAIIDEISRDIQFAGGAVKESMAASPSSFFCVGDKRYSFVIDRQLAEPPTQHVLVTDTVVNCSAPAGQDLNSIIPGSRELLSPNMRISKLVVDDLGDTASDPTDSITENSIFRVEIRLVYGDDDLLNSTHDGCLGAEGSQFCAVSELSTTVQKRVQ